MYRIVRKEALKPTVILYEIEAPMVAKKAAVVIGGYRMARRIWQFQ